MTDADSRVDALFAKYAAPTAALGRALRARLRARLPGLTEIVYFYGGQGALVISYSPTEHGYQGVCTLSLKADGAKLYFSGGPLLAKADPGRILQGAGKTRFVVVRAAADLDRPEIEALVAAALSLAKVRPVAGAKGALILKVEEQEKRAARTKKAPKRG